MSTQRYAEIAIWFETLTPKSLEQVADIYALDAIFIDPFNTLRGVDAVRAVYQHMFDTLEQPRFIVTTTVAQSRQAFMTWDFHFQRNGQGLCISGCTQFELNNEGRIILHRDYWDAAQQVYEKVPILGGVLRLLRRKLSLASK